MLTREVFKAFLQKMVDKHLPDESIIFEIEGDAIIEDAFDGKYHASEQGHGDKFGAVDLISTKLVIELTVLAITTYKLALEILKLRKESKTIELEKIQEKLELKLKSSGMKSSKAKGIAKDFIEEIDNLLT